MLSLQAVFKDILPTYRIKDIDETDMNLSKEVRKQHYFESMLLRTYQSFLRILFKKNKVRTDDGLAREGERLETRLFARVSASECD